MDGVTHENRMLKVAALVLFCALAAGVGTSGSQTQRLPGPGTGVVDVRVVNEPGTTQSGDWKVAQQGEWKVGVTGTVVALPAMPNLVSANRSYMIYWDQANAERVTVLEIHPSGWARVENTRAANGNGQPRWVNLSRAASIVGPS
jgi:hypothetical protein